MIAVEVPTPVSSATKLDVRSLALTDVEFLTLCSDNRDLRLEMTAEGDIIIMSPTGSESGRRNAKLTQRLANWSEGDGTGVSFDSSAGFRLPNGAKRSPDASWVKTGRYSALSQAERESFAPICPDFVIEMRSPTDSLDELQAKMREYVENGAQLGWLIDPFERRVYVYHADGLIEILDDPATVSGDPVLIGFILDLKEIW